MNDDHHTHDIETIHRELHSHLPSEPALRVKAMESVLVEKGMLDPKAVDAWIDFYREEIGPKRGAVVVAKAWNDLGFKARLLEDAESTIRQCFRPTFAVAVIPAIEGPARDAQLVESAWSSRDEVPSPRPI